MSFIANRTRSQRNAPWNNAGPLPQRYCPPRDMNFRGSSWKGDSGGLAERPISKESDDNTSSSFLRRGAKEAFGGKIPEESLFFLSSSCSEEYQPDSGESWEQERCNDAHNTTSIKGKKRVWEEVQFDSDTDEVQIKAKTTAKYRSGRRTKEKKAIDGKKRVKEEVQSDSDTDEVHIKAKTTAKYRSGRTTKEKKTINGKKRVKEEVQSDSDTDEVRIKAKATTSYRTGGGRTKEKKDFETAGVHSVSEMNPIQSLSSRYSAEGKGKWKHKGRSPFIKGSENTSESREGKHSEGFSCKGNNGSRCVIDLVSSSEDDGHYEKRRKAKKKEGNAKKFVGRKGSSKPTELNEEIAECTGWTTQSYNNDRGKTVQEEEDTSGPSFSLRKGENLSGSKQAQRQEEPSESSFDSRYSILETDEDDEGDYDSSDDYSNEEEGDEEEEDNKEEEEEEEEEDEDEEEESKNEEPDLGGVEKQNAPKRLSTSNEHVKRNEFKSVGTRIEKTSEIVYVVSDQDSPSACKSNCSAEIKDGGCGNKHNETDVEHLQDGFIQEEKKTENDKPSRPSRHVDHHCDDHLGGSHKKNCCDYISETKGISTHKMVQDDKKVSTGKECDDNINLNDGVGDVEECDDISDDTTMGEEESNTTFVEDKGTPSSVDISLFDLIVQTIPKINDLPSEDMKQSEERNTIKKDEFPLKFSWDEPETPPRKTESEKKMDELWNDFDFLLNCEETSFPNGHHPRVEVTANIIQVDTSTLPSCQHQLVLDEEIGLKCKICRMVIKEIRDMLPPMVEITYGRTTKKASHEEEGTSKSNRFEWQEFKFHGQSSNSRSGRTVWDVIRDLEPKMFKHQREGFEFVWKNIAGDIYLDNLKSSDSDEIGGCLISHAPGTGKTLLTIAFLRSFVNIFEDSRPMVLAPVTLLSTWEREFKKWGVDVPFHLLNNDNFSGKEAKFAMDLFSRERSKIEPKRRRNLCRLIKIVSWISKKSILGVSYDMFRTLTKEMKKPDSESQTIRKLLLESPGLLILDEGHIARNKASRTWQCLKSVKTQRRIMLSGTPFQNNFLQLFNTLYVIRPNFADGLKERFKDNSNQISRQNLLEEQNETVLRRSFTLFSEGIEPQEDSSHLKELRSIIDPFIHVYEGTDHGLPGLRDYFVYIHPSNLQRRILDKLPDRSNFEYDHRVSCIAVHPSILLQIKDKKDEALAKEYYSDLSKRQINDGVKVKFVIGVVQLCEALNEKVLVFSQFIKPLKIIKDHLLSFFGWKEGREVKQLDGSIIDQKLRQSLIHDFNDISNEVKVLLVSTKVCAEGIDLTGASRVILLDLVWNPSVRRQAISRAFRIGQHKVVHAYNLIAAGTLEERKFGVQDIKDKLSQLVFSTTAKNVALVDILNNCTDKVLCELIDREPHLFHRVLELNC